MVEIENLTFGYPSGGFRLRVPALSLGEGERLAIVGPSGSGKTTLLNLIAHFWDPDTGTISIGGVPLPELPPGVPMDQISMVSQDVALFSGSVFDNIAIGQHGATRKEVAAAARVGTEPADDNEAKLTALLDRVKTDDEARQQFLDVLELMGPDDPCTAEYRKQLTQRLF